MRRRLVSLLGAFALLAALSGGNPAIAAEAEEQGSAAAGSPFGGAFRAGGGSRGPMLLVLRIAEALQLGDEQTVKLAAEFRRVAAQRRTMLAEKTALEAKLEAQLARKPVDEATVSSLTEQLVVLERNLVLLPDELWKSIQPLLTVEQRARLVLLRGKMKKQVDGARQRRRGRGQDRGAADPRDE